MSFFKIIFTVICVSGAVWFSLYVMRRLTFLEVSLNMERSMLNENMQSLSRQSKDLKMDDKEMNVMTREAYMQGRSDCMMEYDLKGMNYRPPQPPQNCGGSNEMVMEFMIAMPMILEAFKGEDVEKLEKGKQMVRNFLFGILSSDVMKQYPDQAKDQLLKYFNDYMDELESKNDPKNAVYPDYMEQYPSYVDYAPPLPMYDDVDVNEDATGDDVGENEVELMSGHVESVQSSGETLDEGGQNEAGEEEVAEDEASYLIIRK